MTDLPKIEIDPNTFLRKHCTLPPLPMVVSRIQEIVQDENVAINDVVELIGSDPGLVAQILKVVNSAYYGLPQEVAKVQFAVAFLGFSEIYRMVLSLSVINTLSIEDSAELEDFWNHSFYAALCTKHLARLYEPQLSFENLWSAAILHDIGKLVYLKFFPEHYRAFHAYAREQGCLFSQAEEHFQQPPSAYLGALLCDHWLLPSKIRDACEFHSLGSLAVINRGTQRGAFQLMVCMGNLVAVLATEELRKALKREIAGRLAAAVDTTEEDFLAVMGQVYELKIEVESFMKRFGA